MEKRLCVCVRELEREREEKERERQKWRAVKEYEKGGRQPPISWMCSTAGIIRCRDSF